MLTMATFGSKHSLAKPNQFQTCHTFEQFSSLKLNLEKSEACWIGSARGKQDKPVYCNWIN